MKKLLLHAVLLVFVPSTHATTRTAASCSVPDIRAQVKLSKDGDTVLVPGSTCGSGAPVTWTTTLTINVGITLNGQGANITWPAVAPQGSIVVNADTTASALITGFTFKGGYVPPGCPITMNSSNSPLTKTSRIYSNTFNNPNTTGYTQICLKGLGPSLVDHNTFTTLGTGETIQLYGQANGPVDSRMWTRDVVPGSANMNFIEDNTFNNQNSLTQVGVINNYYGLATVFRHNTVIFGTVDAHAGSSAGTGTRWMEVYNNTFILTNATTSPEHCQGDVTSIRGGSGMFWGNHVSGSIDGCASGPGYFLGPFCPSSDPCSGTWPLNWQAGRGINNGTAEQWSPFYAWGNDVALGALRPRNAPYVQIGASPTNASCTHPGNVCDGVDLGSGVSMPATLTRCQSAADLAAGCPVTYTYTPYTYPHPLVTGTLPPPPVNVRIVAQ